MITFQRIEAHSWQHAVSDKKHKPTRYEVLRDGVKIGEVSSHSEESWQTSGRIRTRFLGYSRDWRYQPVGAHRDYPSFRGSRAGAVKVLIEVVDGKR